MSSAPSNPSIGRLPSGVLFAAGLVLMTGTLQFIWGVSAITKARYFDAHELLLESLATWGWIYVVIGLLQVGIAAMIFKNKPLGFALGMFGAFVSIMVDFLTIGAYPWWSLILIVLSFIVFFQLATNLDER